MYYDHDHNENDDDGSKDYDNENEYANFVNDYSAIVMIIIGMGIW